MCPTEREVLAKLYANSQESIFVLDATRKILVTNPRALEDTSFEQEELIGKAFVELFLPDERSAIESLLDATVQWNAGTDPRRTLKRKSGKKIIVEISTMALDFEGAPAIACSLRDITDRVRDEEKIRETSAELEKINAELEERVKARTETIARQKKELDDVMNNIQEAILTIGSELKINPGVSAFSREVLGRETLEGEALPELLLQKADARDNLSAWLKQVFEQPEMWDVIQDFGPKEVHFHRTSDGQDRDLRCEWRPIREAERIVKIMLVCQDITEQKLLEAEISRREAEHREELELIAQLIDVSPELMDQFVRDFELALKQGQTILAADTVDRSGFDSLLRGMHTFKGASRQVGLRTLGSRAHHLEELVQGEIPDLERVRKEFSDLKTGTEKILEIYRKVTRGGDPAPASGHADVHLAEQKISALSQRLGPPLKHGEDLRKTLLWLLEAPAHTMLERCAGIATSTAKELGKTVEVQLEGQDVRLDQRILQHLGAALPHAIRNSIDHGGESPEVRKSKGKSEALKLRISLARFGDHATLLVEDDGKGVDVEKVRAAAVAKKLVDPERAKQASAEAALRFLLLPGLSTRTEVSEISGRGVGLDVLDETVTRSLGGEVHLESAPEKGLKIELTFRADALTPPPVFIPEHWPEHRAEHEKERRASIAEKISALQNQPLLRHWVDPETPHADFLRLILQKTEAFERPPGVEFFLEPGTPIMTSRFLDYSKKNEVLEVLGTKTHDDFPSFDQVSAEIGEELLMNAFFDAPRDAQGNAKYATRSRKDKLVLEPWEAPTLRWARDSRFFAASITDPFGALTKETFFRYLEKGFRKGADQIDRKPGGAGLGLYTLVQLTHWLGVFIEPGVRTEMICLVGRGRSFEAYQRGAKSLSFWDRSGRARA